MSDGTFPLMSGTHVAEIIATSAELSRIYTIHSFNDLAMQIVRDKHNIKYIYLIIYNLLKNIKSNNTVLLLNKIYSLRSSHVSGERIKMSKMRDVDKSSRFKTCSARLQSPFVQ